VRGTGLLAVLAVGLIGLVGCGSSSSSSGGSTDAAVVTKPAASTATATATTPAATATTGAAGSAGGCRKVATPAPKASPHLTAPTLKLDPTRRYTVTVATNCGTFAFTLNVKQSPKTSASLYYLIKRGFYDGTTFQRVAAGFVIQGGDPTGTGGGGSGYTVVEPPPAQTQYVRGDVAMAKTQAQPSGASGSQFFVVTGANISQSGGLTPDYALAGKVVSGIGVVEKIGALPTNPASDGVPSPTVVMQKVTVAGS
jgi:peptidyl-prolyl cis-trans isomerase B (cyclophilin B)